MKTLLRSYFYSLFSLWFTTLIISGFIIRGGISSLLYSALIFAFLNILVKPLMKVVFFPINLVTFGLFSWLINVALLYLLVRLSHQVFISTWDFPGFHFANVAISSYHLADWQTFIVTSLIIGIIVNLLFWLAK